MTLIRETFVPEGSRPALYCPLAVGGHIDHRIVRDTILEHRDELARAYDLYFYEDLFYAADRRARQAGLLDFMILAGPVQPSRVVLPVDPDLKVKLLNLYPSQLADGTANIERFTPAAGTAPHEAAWVLPRREPG